MSPTSLESLIRQRITRSIAATAGALLLVIIMGGIWTGISDIRRDLDHVLNSSVQLVVSNLQRQDAFMIQRDLQRYLASFADHRSIGVDLEVSVGRTPIAHIAEGLISEPLAIRGERLQAANDGQVISVKVALGVHRIFAAILIQALIAIVIAITACILIRARFRSTSDRITRATSDIIQRVSAAARAVAAGGGAIWEPSSNPGGVLEIDRLDEAASHFAASLTKYRHLLDETRAAALDAERRAAASQAIAETVQMIAHDVRKPFSKMRAGLSLLNNARGADRVDHLINRLVPEVSSAIASVNRMLTDVMDHGAESPLVVEQIDPVKLLNIAIGEVLPSHPEANIEIESHWGHNKTMTVDVQKLQRVLQNIIENAVQAMGGHGRLWFVTEQLENATTLTIGNSGSYIPEEDVARIFDTFFTKGKRGGTGLGLAIARKIVEQHGGHIACRSEIGRGVEFILKLPRSEGDSAVEPHGLPQHSGAYRIDVGSRQIDGAEGIVCAGPEGLEFDVEIATTGISPLVAIVEDDVFCAEDWEQALSSEVDCSIFSKPEEFLARLENDEQFSRSLSVVVTDFHFDGSSMTGFDVASATTRRGEIPVLLASGVELPAEARHAFSAIIEKTAVDFATLKRSFGEKRAHHTRAAAPSTQGH